MPWTDHAIFWHVYPLGACGAPRQAADQDESPGQAPRLRRLHAWLPYVIELGCNALLLGPVFASASHGYDTVDHLRVDPRLGTEEDLTALIEDARGRGIAVVLDGVFNHVGDRHPLWLAAREGGPGSEAGRLFRWSGEHGYGFEGNPDLLTLNHADPRAEDLVVDVMTYWLDRGVAGWRLDAAYAIDPAFWARVLPRVRERHPQAWFAGEMIHGDYAGYAATATLDSITQYELWKATWSSLTDRNFFELDWTLARHQELCGHLLPMTFAGNHDVTRIASRAGDGGALLAATLLLTLPGVPSIYYGDEQGFRGVKEERAGGDDAVRPALPEHPGGLSRDGEWLLRAHQELIGIRRRCPWIVHGRVEVTTLENEQIVYQVSGGPADEQLTVHLSLHDGWRATVRQGERVLFEQCRS